MPEHVEQISTQTLTYRVTVGGTLDGQNTRDPIGYGSFDQAYENNVFVSMENRGTEAVVNPWLIVNGKRWWRSYADILDSILTEAMSDKEKARAIWEFARSNRYHNTTADDEVKDTIKMLNIYGYSLCWDEAYTVSNLWQAAGLMVRRGVPHGHCTTEVFFGGAYHLLDSDEHLLFLLRDNETIASEEDLARDHDLVKRGHAYGILSPENRQTSERAAALFVYDGPRSGGRDVIGSHTMDMTLRPGEAMVWEWEDRDKYHGHWEKPPRSCNGRMQYMLPLNEGFEEWCESVENMEATDDGLQPTDLETESVVCFRVRSPYVIVGGKVIFSGTNARLEISFDNEYWEYVTSMPGQRPRVIPLDDHFPAEGTARYEYVLRLSGHGIHVKRMFIETDLQMAPLSLPALEVGENSIEYMDENAGTRNIQITHGWYEKSDVIPPGRPSGPIFPSDGAEVAGTQFTFAWATVDEASDYMFQLSSHEDMRYALSPVFEKLSSKTPAEGRAEWTIPEAGLLNPDQVYFWRVRCRNSAGLWGRWSETWRFAALAPAVPRNLRIDANWDSRTLNLTWDAPEHGTPVSHYELYGSDERGFSISREAYEAVVGGEMGVESFPENFLTTVEDTSVSLTDIIGRKGSALPCFYRVVAVNGQGMRSGPSEFVSSPRPFIHSQPPRRITASKSAIYQVAAVRSLGDLRALSKGATRYKIAYRDGDVLTYILDEGPPWLVLDKTGQLTASPGADAVGTHTVTIRVQNGQGGVDVQGFDLRVVEA
ncbi:MAG: hypothetical protein HOH43_01905 [Candidatus Latescibacteria bacterium]|nr:hypothetical protein [Candidatus Latescibacterota bacterium]